MPATFTCEECGEELTYTSSEDMNFETQETGIGKTDVLVCPNCSSRLSIPGSLSEDLAQLSQGVEIDD